MRPWLLYFVFVAVYTGTTTLADGVSPQEAKQLRDEVGDMFYHAFNGYMKHAFPLDELRPLSCKGEDSLGGYALTLIDSLDTLALLGDRERFTSAVEWVSRNVQFNIDKTVSVFETTIRILGGLLSAHLIASDYATGMKVQNYNNELLHLAEDLALRMLPAFDTPTGIPFGSVNLRHGVDENESKITSTAGGGTLTLEFGVLSRLTNNTIFERVSKNAVRGIWARRSQIDLVGAHINVFSGEWTQKDAGIGTSIDSFYEYLLKAYLLFGDEEYLFMFQEAYKAAMRYLHHDPWYVEVNMNSAATVWPLFNSLQAFWPGLQVLAGDIDPAIRTHAAFFSVWKKYGYTPEGFNLATLSVQNGQRSYPLRPELIESTYWLYKATRDRRYLEVGRDMLTSLQYGAKCPCGYCHISDVESHKQDDHMESFFLAETSQLSRSRIHAFCNPRLCNLVSILPRLTPITEIMVLVLCKPSLVPWKHKCKWVKYLWLLFDLAVDSDNIVESGPYKYIFSTEGHLLPATPEIALASEHCSYFGSFCKGDDRCSYGILSNTRDSKDRNGTQKVVLDATIITKSRSLDLVGARGFVKGDCAGLTHAQKFGISYFEEKEDESTVARKEPRTEVEKSEMEDDNKVENEDLETSSTNGETRKTQEEEEKEGKENRDLLKVSQFVIEEDNKNANQEAQTIHDVR